MRDLVILPVETSQPRVAHLPTCFGVERRLVENDLDFLTDWSASVDMLRLFLQ